MRLVEIFLYLELLHTLQNQESLLGVYFRYGTWEEMLNLYLNKVCDFRMENWRFGGWSQPSEVSAVLDVLL